MSKKHFTSQDIGGDLLPIITSGLYRDPLDTLREYIQNSIDADARHIELKISSDLISIRDDGSGMSKQIAEGAIRLGISEKRPDEDVGFRGIGVYSAYNICNKLEIFTRHKNGEKFRLVFEFEEIRKRLKKEEILRNNGQIPSLYLEKLLTGAVWVEDCDDSPLAANGTLVMMVGIKGDVYEKFIDNKRVTDYLESVIPLPFHPDFSHKTALEEKFQREDYRVVELELSIDGHNKKLYRPYRDYIFRHGKGFGPKIFELKNILIKGKLGFAWVCLNDARKYIDEKKFRGLLVKKFGFSVGGREYFSSFFSRSVFNNRITGEIIITHHSVIPNAARTEFEPGPVRDSLYIAFNEIANNISNWANSIQQELKAREELETIAPDAFKLIEAIPQNERDVPKLLYYNNLITSYQNRLKTHRVMLIKQDKDLYDKTTNVLAQAQNTITEILTVHQSQQGAKGRRRRLKQSRQAVEIAPDEKKLKYAQDTPKNILELIGALDIEITPPLRLVFEYIDKEIFQEKFNHEEYALFLENLGDYLEESL